MVCQGYTVAAEAEDHLAGCVCKLKIQIWRTSVGLMSYFVFFHARAQGTQRSGAKYFLGREEASLLISVPADSRALYIHWDDSLCPQAIVQPCQKNWKMEAVF